MHVLDFWYSQPMRSHWFGSKPELDGEILGRFRPLWEAAAMVSTYTLGRIGTDDRARSVPYEHVPRLTGQLLDRRRLAASGGARHRGRVRHRIG